MTKLLIRPVPFQEESLQQYILRLARSNGYTNKSAGELIKQVSGIPIHTYMIVHREELKRKLMKMTGHNEVQSLFDHKFWYKKYKKVFNYDRIKLCPLCLLENNHCYSYWHFRHALTCEKHKILLIDTCWTCLRVLSEFSLTSMVCVFCGVDVLPKINRKITFDNRVNNYFSPFSDLDGLCNKIDALKPYFELYQEKSYQLWAKNNSYSIKERITLINAVLDVFNSEQLTTHTIDEFMNKNKDCASISIAIQKIYAFLSHDTHPIFTRLFAERLLVMSKLFPLMLITSTVVDRLYKVNVIKTKEINIHSRLEYKELGMVFRRRDICVIKMEKLPALLKISGYKFN